MKSLEILITNSPFKKNRLVIQKVCLKNCHKKLKSSNLMKRNEMKKKTIGRKSIKE